MTNILVVDDRPDWRTTIENLLKSYNKKFRIKSVANSEQAFKTSFDIELSLAIIDLKLKGDDPEDYSGVELAISLQKYHPQVKIILITEHNPSLSKVFRPVIYSGYTDFVAKDQLESKLKDAVDRAFKEPAYEKNTNQLTLSFQVNHPIWLRASGSYVISTRAGIVLDLPFEKYRFLAEKIYGTGNRHAFISDIGKTLHKRVLEDDDNLSNYFGRIEEAARHKILNVCFEASRELIGVPFEFMHIGSQYLILQHPVTRFVTGTSPVREALSPELFSNIHRRSLKVLLISSDTFSDDLGLSSIPNVDVEIEKLTKFFQQRIQEKGDIELEVMSTKEASLPNITEKIKDWKPNIIHYAGHGFYDENSTDQSSLYFWSKENKKGDCVELKAYQIESLLGEREKSETQFVYLSCCEGAATGNTGNLVRDNFLGISDAIIQAGVPSVLGFRWPLSDESAPIMAQEFYQSLLSKGSLPIALFDARRALYYRKKDDITWLSPILIHQT